MSIYVWGIPDDYPEKAIAEYDYDESPDCYDFMHGQIAPEPKKPLIFDMEAKLSEFTVFDHLCNNSVVPLINCRLQKLFNQYCPEDIQYLDTIIHYPGGSTTEYKAINITHEVVSVDFNHSECEYFDEGKAILGFKRLVLLPNCLGNWDLARMAEYHPKLLVSAKLAALFTQHKITGVDLETPQESTSYIDRTE